VVNAACLLIAGQGTRGAYVPCDSALPPLAMLGLSTFSPVTYVLLGILNSPYGVGNYPGMPTVVFQVGSISLFEHFERIFGTLADRGGLFTKLYEQWSSKSPKKVRQILNMPGAQTVAVERQSLEGGCYRVLF
jgi:hypothetical protein